MSDIPAPLREQVMLRAGNRCEYCGLSQAGQEAAFHVDHVAPRIAGGPTELDNLALACVSCSLRKWALRSGSRDGRGGALVQPARPGLGGSLPLGGSGGRALDADGAGDGGRVGDESPAGYRHTNGGGRARAPSATMSGASAWPRGEAAANMAIQRTRLRRAADLWR
jgi:hypothetical protein